MSTSTEATFEDVPPNNPYFTYVETAFQSGLLPNSEEDTFRPNDNLTQQEFEACASSGKVEKVSAAEVRRVLNQVLTNDSADAKTGEPEKGMTRGAAIHILMTLFGDL